MTRVDVPVAESILDAKSLGAWARETYALREPADCRLVSHGANDVYAISSGSDRLFLRVAPHGWRTTAETLAELTFIDAVYERGGRVARARRQANGKAIAKVSAPEGERLTVLFEKAKGGDVRDIDGKQAREIGRLAAIVHDTADSFGVHLDRFQLDEGFLLDEPLGAIQSRFGGEAEQTAFVADVANVIRMRLEDVSRSATQYGPCHGDLHPGNVRFDETGEASLFDFDFCGYGWRMYDLTVFLWNAYGERRPKRWREDRWRAFLAGYRETRPVSSDVLDFVPVFLAARQIWLMGLDCRGRSGWPVQWVNAGWLQDMVGPIRTWVSEHAVLRP